MNWFYNSRESRSRWLAERFEKEIAQAKTVLDVGCHNRDFKKHIPDTIKYTGIDIAGQPDIKINLDQTEALPFEDNQFGLTICADVLEHLENIHLIFDELCRVSSRYIIVTLPNAMASIPELLKGKYYTRDREKQKQFGTYMKFHGLPLEKPDDRHRWYFSYEEASRFIKYRSEKFGFRIVAEESERQYQKASIRKSILGMFGMLNKNFINRHYMCLLRKEKA